VKKKWDWRRAASRAISRNDHRNIVAGAVAGLGGAIAIGAMEWFSVAAHYPLFVIPFATSIVLVIGSPEAEPAQPRALIGGHVVTILVGLAVLKLTGPQAWATAAAVGLSILAMYLTGTFHPPPVMAAAPVVAAFTASRRSCRHPSARIDRRCGPA
jgi:CBS-domain-containing membrane protein